MTPLTRDLTMPTPEDFAAFAGCYAYAAHRVERRLSRVYDVALAPVGITLRQFAVLAEAAYAPGLPVARLARRLSVDPTTLTRALRPLIERGLMALTASSDDARVRQVEVSPEGLVLIEAATPLWRKAQDDITHALGADAAAHLTATLDDTSQRLRQLRG